MTVDAGILGIQFIVCVGALALLHLSSMKATQPRHVPAILRCLALNWWTIPMKREERVQLTSSSRAQADKSRGVEQKLTCSVMIYQWKCDQSLARYSDQCTVRLQVLHGSWQVACERNETNSQHPCMSTANEA